MSTFRHPSASEIARDAARVRRKTLLWVLLSFGRPLDGREIRWAAERNPLLSAARTGGDLAALIDCGLVVRVRGPGHAPDYAPTRAARRLVRH